MGRLISFETTKKTSRCQKRNIPWSLKTLPKKPAGFKTKLIRLRTNKMPASRTWVVFVMLRVRRFFMIKISNRISIANSARITFGVSK